MLFRDKLSIGLISAAIVWKPLIKQYMMSIFMGIIGEYIMASLITRFPKIVISKGENLKVSSKNPRASRITVQKHNADRAGLHYDFRFRYYPYEKLALHRKLANTTGKLISFAVRKEPPPHYNDPRAPEPYKTLFVRQPDHLIQYESFSGTIKSGYGKGTVEIVYQSPGIIWTQEGEYPSINVFTPYSNNPWSGYWKIFPKTGLAIRTPAFYGVWFPRNTYKMASNDFGVSMGKLLMKEGDNSDIRIIAERKIDGMNMILYNRAPGLEDSAGAEALEKAINLRSHTVPADGGNPSYKISHHHQDITYPLNMERVEALWKSYNLYGSKYHKSLARNKMVPFTISHISRRYSKEGFPIVRSGGMSHASFINLPIKIASNNVRRVYRAENFHSRGIRFTSGIGNSLPEKAISTQKEHGYMHSMLFDFVGVIGKKGTLIPSSKDYYHRRVEYEALVEALNSGDLPVASSSRLKSIFCVPDYVIGSLDDARKFYRKVISKPLPFGEGVVLKTLDDWYNSNDSPDKDLNSGGGSPWLKVKRVNTFDLIVNRVEHGTGRLTHSMGKLVLTDRTGNELCKVGTGFSDEDRAWWWNNRNNPNVIGKTVVEVKAQDLGKEKLRAPVFLGVRDDKDPSESDIVVLPSSEDLVKEYLLGQGVPKSDLDSSLYALKVSSGWFPGKNR